ncbi:unnamed protein product [Linum trigynum]|uniref:Uncharacterized protein n=1 Tax=Linum trigynum TaxID=586398 RepID=A0AAV2EDR6_9ROSI
MEETKRCSTQPGRLDKANVFGKVLVEFDSKTGVRSFSSDCNLFHPLETFAARLPQSPPVDMEYDTELTQYPTSPAYAMAAGSFMPRGRTPLAKPSKSCSFAGLGL